MSLFSRQVPHLRLRLLQPVRHAHLTVHRRRGGEMLLRLLALAGAQVELAEVTVAVGHERAHAELIGQMKGLTIEALCLVEVWCRTPGRKLGETPPHPNL